MKYETIVTRLTIRPVGGPIFANEAIHVEMEDEAAGEFVVIRQCRDDSEQSVRVDPDEWPTVRSAVNRIARTCGKLPHPLAPGRAGA